MSHNDLTTALKEYQEYKRIKEQAEEQMKAIQSRITAHMDMQGMTEMVVDIYKVSYKPISSTRLDTKILKIARPDIFAQFSTTSTSKRFIVA